MRALTFPPLTEDNNSPMKWLSVKFDSGLVSVEITDEGGGAFAVIETSDQWRIEAEELLAFANWVAEAVAAVDENCGNARSNTEAQSIAAPSCLYCSEDDTPRPLTPHGRYLDGSIVYKCAACNLYFAKPFMNLPYIEVPAAEIIEIFTEAQ